MEGGDGVVLRKRQSDKWMNRMRVDEFYRQCPSDCIDVAFLHVRFGLSDLRMYL